MEHSVDRPYDESDLDRPNFEGAKYVYTPPPRQRDDREALWRALADGTLSVLSSDHCAFRWRVRAIPYQQ